MAETPDHPCLDAAIFKAYDIRGIVDAQIDAAVIALLGKALAAEAHARGVRTLAVGRDGRHSSPLFSESLIQSLLGCGIDVIDVGLVSSPLLYFAAHHYAGGSGVMVTASHNPPQYNGLKIMLKGQSLSGEAIQQLKVRLNAPSFPRGEGRLSRLAVLDAYQVALTDAIKLSRPLKLVVDGGNGSAAETAPKLLRALGCEVVELYCRVDGDFPHHAPDPSQPENLADLIAAVRAEQADLGLAFDGDGDRLGVVSAEGAIIWPDRLMMLFAGEILQAHPGAAIVHDVKCSSLLGRLIEAKGGRSVMSASGHSLMKTKLVAEDALLAGELSGHLYFRDEWYGFDDALYAAARLLRIMDRHEGAAREIFQQLPDSANTPELRIAMGDEQARRMVEALSAQVAQRFGDGKLCLLDGVRVDFPEGFILVRASNTTPSLVLRMEGRTPAVLDELKQRMRQTLLALAPDLKLPF